MLLVCCCLCSYLLFCVFIVKVDFFFVIVFFVIFYFADLSVGLLNYFPPYFINFVNCLDQLYFKSVLRIHTILMRIRILDPHWKKMDPDPDFLT